MGVPRPGLMTEEKGVSQARQFSNSRCLSHWGRHFLICGRAMFIIEKVCIRVVPSITRTRTIPKNYTEFLFKKALFVNFVAFGAI
jgi:hypothetical protein